MAFQPPTQQEHKNRTILAQIEEQKKRYRMHPHASNMATPPQGQGSTPMMPQAPLTNVTVMQETAHMSPNQRKELQHANTHSFGFFITQDSLYGNLILPVLPRVSEKP